jgi:hypothetical protein
MGPPWLRDSVDWRDPAGPSWSQRGPNSHRPTGDGRAKWDYGELTFSGPWIGRRTNVSTVTDVQPRWASQTRPARHQESPRTDVSRRTATPRDPRVMMSKTFSAPALFDEKSPHEVWGLLAKRPELHKRTYTDAQPWSYELRTTYKWQIPQRTQGWHTISHGNRHDFCGAPEIPDRGLKMRLAEMEAKFM